MTSRIVDYDVQFVCYDKVVLASKMMVSRQTVSDLLHERKAVTAEMAIRIARTVHPKHWDGLQK